VRCPRTQQANFLAYLCTIPSREDNFWSCLVWLGQTIEPRFTVYEADDLVITPCYGYQETNLCSLPIQTKFNGPDCFSTFSLFNTFARGCLLKTTAVKGDGVVQCGQVREECLQMRTSTLYGTKNFRFFEMYSVSAWTRVEGWVGVKILRTRRGQFFAILCKLYQKTKMMK